MSFLRRKSKQDPSPKQPVIISSPAAPAPTPLFAKFASSTSGNAPPARNVSGPMVLSSKNSINGGRYPASRDSRNVPKATVGPPSSWSGQAPDRPIPANSQVQVRNFSRPLKSRTSASTFEDKPLPAPGQQSSPMRRPSVQTSFSPPPQANGSSSNITNLLDDEFDFELPTPIAQPRQEVRTAANANGGGSQQRMSYAVDLPPEYALFQEFSAVSSNPPDSSPSRKVNQQQATATYTAPNLLAGQSTPLPANMGNNISAASNLYPSAVGSFQSTRAFVNPQPQFSAATPKAAFRKSLQADALPPPVSQNTAQYADFNVPQAASAPFCQPSPPAGPVPKGKPKIFAAMATVDIVDDSVSTPMQRFPPNPHSSPSYSNQHLAPQPPSQFPSPSRQAVQRPPFDPSSSPPPTHTTSQSVIPDQYNNGYQARTPRQNDSRQLPPASPPPAQTQQLNAPSVHGSPRTPKKLSRVRHNPDASAAFPNPASNASIMSASVESLHSSSHGHFEHGQGLVKVHADGHRTLSKILRPGSSHGHKRSASRSPSKVEAYQSLQPAEEDHPTQVDDETMMKAGIPLDDDPFAKVEGVKMLSPLQDQATLEAKRKHAKDDSEESKSVVREEASIAKVDLRSEASAPREGSSSRKAKSTTGSGSTSQSSEERRRERREKRAREKEERKAKEREAAAAAEAEAAEAEAAARTSGIIPSESEAEIEPVIDGEPDKLEEPKFFPFTQFLSNPQILGNLLGFMTFYDWCILSSVTREIRIMLVQSPLLREEVLERFLKTVGYSRWSWDGKDPLQLSLQDLADYMRGVSMPSHEYARVAKMYVHSLTVHPSVRDTSLDYTLRGMTTSTRAYTRVVLRLRAQAEKEAAMASANPSRSSSVPPPSASGPAKAANGYSNGYVNGYAPSRSMSRPSSRAPSPTMSNYSHYAGSPSQIGHGSQSGHSSTMQHGNSSQTSLTFRSPLFRLRRAPLLRVFVPSPEGDWLSDKSVLDCEAELKKAGVLHLMRTGDVVWDIAVGDEGNVGRLVYDGKYLIDLDYTYNPIGDLPKYISTLAFPPSYFHRVIRTGAITSNPIAHIDVSPWGEEIAANLQLLQDRVKTETPQGAYHNVVRWVHRSSFAIRPPARVMQRGPSTNGRAQQPYTPRIPIPDTENQFIDQGWYGILVVETEGTNEALADLQERCGPRAFPPRPKPANPAMAKAREENRKVWRILRERSRPGEIWIKAVSVKERLL